VLFSVKLVFSDFSIRYQIWDWCLRCFFLWFFC